MRDACEIALVLPFGSPVPPSPETSRALLAAFAERNIDFIPSRRVASVDNARNVAILDDGRRNCPSIFSSACPNTALPSWF